MNNSLEWLSNSSQANYCEHVDASFIESDVAHNITIKDAYNAAEYSHYLQQLLNAVKDMKLDVAKSIINLHEKRTKCLGGDANIQWDIINDVSLNWSPFHLSIFIGYEKMYLWLLSEGGDVTHPTYDSWGCLALAVFGNKPIMVNLLIAQSKIDVNYVSRRGSALHIAANDDNVEIMRILLTHPKLNLNVLDNENQTPLDVVGPKCKPILQNELTNKYREEQQRMLNSLHNSMVGSTTQNSFLQNRPKKPPIFKGIVLKVNYFKLFMYPRYIVVDPESGVLARFESQQNYPLQPKELISLDTINEVEISRGRWFQKEELHYLRIQYINKSIFFAFQQENTAQKWLQSIKLSVGYQRYIKSKLEHYIICKGDRKAYSKVISLLMENANQEMEIKDIMDYSEASIKSVFRSLSVQNVWQFKMGIKDIQSLQLIGRGAFGMVYKVMLRINGQIYALKQQAKDKLLQSSYMDYAKNEIKLIKTLFHPFLVNVHCAFQTEKNLYFMMDYYQYGDLSQYITKGVIIEEMSAKFLICQVILAIEYLHSQNIVYRDLKPENIIIDNEGYVKVIDFGLAKKWEPNRQALSFCGSPAYLSPEVLTGKGATYATDIYSIGLILYEMLIGYPPHYTKNLNELVSRIKYDSINLDRVKSKSASRLLDSMIQKDPLKRLTMAEVKSHIYFAEIDWDRLKNKQMIPPKLTKQHRSNTLGNGEHQCCIQINDVDYENDGDIDNYIQDWDFN